MPVKRAKHNEYLRKHTVTPTSRLLLAQTAQKKCAELQNIASSPHLQAYSSLPELHFPHLPFPYPVHPPEPEPRNWYTTGRKIRLSNAATNSYHKIGKKQAATATSPPNKTSFQINKTVANKYSNSARQSISQTHE
eukprot:g45665.t1